MWSFWLNQINGIWTKTNKNRTEKLTGGLKEKDKPRFSFIPTAQNWRRIQYFAISIVTRNKLNLQHYMINLKPCRTKVTDHPIFGHVRAGFDLRLRVQKWTTFQTDRTMDCAFFWALFFLGVNQTCLFYYVWDFRPKTNVVLVLATMWKCLVNTFYGLYQPWYWQSFPLCDI